MKQILLMTLTVIYFSSSITKGSDLKIKLNNLKKQTVKIHNDILINNKEKQWKLRKR